MNSSTFACATACTSNAMRRCCGWPFPYGLLSSAQLRALGGIARRYDRGYGHFTTRQNIQYNWPKLEAGSGYPGRARRRRDACHPNQRQLHPQHDLGSSGRASPRTNSRIRGRGAKSSGSGRLFTRNSPTCRANSRLRSRARRRIAPPRWFMTSACTSCAAPDGEMGFEILAGGGLGRTPDHRPGGARVPAARTSAVLSRGHAADLQPRGPARQPDQSAHQDPGEVSLGIEEFRRRVEAEWAAIRDAAGRGSTRRRSPACGPSSQPPATAGSTTPIRRGGKDAAFRAWYRYNTARAQSARLPRRVRSLKKPDVAPGDATDAQMELIADLADRYSFGEVRVTHTQNLLLADVEQDARLRTVAALAAPGSRRRTSAP